MKIVVIGRTGPIGSKVVKKLNSMGHERKKLKNMNQEYLVKDNEEEKQFEMIVDGKIAYVEYILTKQGVIYLTHTEVPKKLEGHGFAFRMIELVLENIQQHGLKLVPMCPIVAAFIQRNPKWKVLLSENINV